MSTAAVLLRLRHLTGGNRVAAASGTRLHGGTTVLAAGTAYVHATTSTSCCAAKQAQSSAGCGATRSASAARCDAGGGHAGGAGVPAADPLDLLPPRGPLPADLLLELDLDDCHRQQLDASLLAAG